MLCLNKLSLIAFRMIPLLGFTGVIWRTGKAYPAGGTSIRQKDTLMSVIWRTGMAYPVGGTNIHQKDT